VASNVTELVWYACYGSNCSYERFRAYLEGGSPRGGNHVHPGARNASLPVASGPITFPHAVCFSGYSKGWGGSPAFLEHTSTVSGALGRRYLITREQFEDVLTQENRLDAPIPVDVHRPVGDRQLVCERPYGQVLTLSPIDGYPVLTFTSPEPPETRTPGPPSAAYLGTLSRGLAEIQPLDADQIASRLLEASGIALGWDHASIMKLIVSPEHPG
jgi:hypothetical protein